MTAYEYIVEVLRANMFDGDDGGRVTMPVHALLSEVAEILSGRYAEPTSYPKIMESPAVPLTLAYHLLFDHKDTLPESEHYDDYLALRAIAQAMDTAQVTVPQRNDDKEVFDA